MGNITISGLQKYIQAKDYQPELKKDYFLKLSEEVGDLPRIFAKMQSLLMRAISKALLKKKYTTLSITRLPLPIAMRQMLNSGFP